MRHKKNGLAWHVPISIQKRGCLLQALFPGHLLKQEAPLRKTSCERNEEPAMPAPYDIKVFGLNPFSHQSLPNISLAIPPAYFSSNQYHTSSLCVPRSNPMKSSRMHSRCFTAGQSSGISPLLPDKFLNLSFVYLTNRLNSILDRL